VTGKISTIQMYVHMTTLESEQFLSISCVGTERY
jgi:hypothetical protein